MRKFLPIVFCGLAAVSYSQLGAAAEGDADQKPTAGSASAGATTDENSGATRDQSGVYRNKDDKRAAKRGHDSDSSAGSSSSKDNSKPPMGKESSTSEAPSSSPTPGSTSKGAGY